MTQLRNPVLSDYLSLMLVSAVWGSSFFCNEIALEHFPPFAIAGWRVVMATLVLLPICAYQKLTWSPNLRTLFLFCVIGILNSILPFTLIAAGQKTVSSGLAGLLFAASPFVTLFWSHLLTRDDRFSKRRLLGLVIGFSGVVVLFAGELIFSGNSLSGMLLILVAAACYALSGVLIRKLGHLPSMIIATGSLVCTTAIALPVLLVWYPPWQQTSSLTSFSALLYLAVCSTALAYVIRAKIVSTNGAVFMSNAGYLIPLFAVLWAWLILAEAPTVSMLVSMVLVFSGIYISQRPPAGDTLRNA